MKILHIITSLGSGGAEGMLYRLIKTSNESVEHSVICINNGGKYVTFLRKAGIEVLVLNFKFFYFVRAIRQVLKFSRSKKNQGYLVITSWLLHADLISWFIKYLCGYKSLVWNIRNSKLQVGRSSFKNWFLLKILALLSHFGVDKVIANSNSAREIHTKIGYRKDNFLVIPNGYFVDTKKKFSKEKKEYNGTYKICIVARWSNQKDFENLFQALSILLSSNVRFNLTIAGNNTGPDNYRLIKIINKYKISKFCSLIGEVDNVDDIYMNSHVTVLSSSYGESFPNVLAESMLNFTPCVATDVGDTANILDGVGLIVPIRDPKALASALKENLRVLMHEKDIYFSNCVKCYEKICRYYDIHNVANYYKDLWKSLL